VFPCSRILSRVVNDIPQPRIATNQDNDWVTLAAIGIVAFVTTDMIHEAIGHGSVFLLIGGKTGLLTTGYFSSEVAGRWLSAGWPLANTIAGSILWFVLHRARGLSVRVKYFLWLCMAYNLFFGFGYLMYSGLANFGDWAAVIAGLEPWWAWRGALVVLGIAAYRISMKIVADEGGDFLSTAPGEKFDWRIVLVPYFAAGIAACAAAYFNPLGPVFILTTGAAASFGAGIGFVLIRGVFANAPGNAGPARVTRSWAWIVAGAIVLVVFVAVVGPGIKIHVPR
jgi:hypothetical protein